MYKRYGDQVVKPAEITLEKPVPLCDGKRVKKRMKSYNGGREGGGSKQDLDSGRELARGFRG